MADKLTLAERDLFEKMCSLLCDDQEMAHSLRMTVDEMREKAAKAYGAPYDEVRAEYTAVGRRNLRAAQMQSALNGNPTMQIWLGKQYLGQKDAPEPSDQRPAIQSKEVPLNVILNKHAQRRAAGAHTSSA